MTTHSKRLKLINRRFDNEQNSTPSIMSSGASESSVGSRKSTNNKPIKDAFQPQTIPENFELTDFSDKESMLIPKPTYKFKTGACSSIISSRSGQSSSKIGSQLSIGSNNRIITPSRSLHGSKASLASEKSFKSSIQQEFHDIKVKRKITALSYGRARRPFLYSIISFVFGGICFFIGITILMFRIYGNLFLSIDKGEVIGPIFIVAGLVLLSIGIKFMIDAYQFGVLERKRLGFRAAGPNMVALRVVSDGRQKQKEKDFVQTGTVTADAVRKVHHPESLGAYPSTSVLH